MPVRSKNDKEPRASVTAHAVTGGLEGAAGIYGIEPLLDKYVHGKGWKNPFRDTVKGHLRKIAIGAAVGAAATAPIGYVVERIRKKRKEAMMESTTNGMFEFAKKIADEFDEKIPRVETKYSKPLTIAGVGAAALGASTLSGASKFFGIRGRATARGFGFTAKNEGGKMVADYIEGAQLLLNRGLRGKAAGAVINSTLNNPKGVVARVTNKAFGGSVEMGPRLTGEHFARFRAGPLEALKFWDYEHGNAVASRIAKQDESATAAGRAISTGLAGRRKRASDELHYGREKTHAAIKEQVEKHGKSEMEALKHVAYNNPDPQVQNYFNQLASNKQRAAAGYSIKALTSPALIAGGAGAVVVGRKKNERADQALRRNVRLESIVDDVSRFIEFASAEDYPRLKSGVRLDKYKKQIRAGEIDRHIHDYLRSAAIGSIAGAAIPGSLGLKKRAFAGAGAGTAVQGILHAAGHRDAYGEQSEEAKLIQRNAPKYVGAAAVVGGLVARVRKRRFNMPEVPVRVKFPWSS